MSVRLTLFLTIALGLGITACDDTEPEFEAEDARPGDVGALDRGLGDKGVPDAMPDVRLDPDAMNPDIGDIGDANISLDMAIPPDQGAPRVINDCQGACDRLAECEELASLFGDEQNCLSECDRSSRAGPPGAWFRCLAAEACNLVELCNLPEAPPLSCEETCAAVDNCEIDVPFECATDCNANLVVCGESLVGGACNEAAFRDCLPSVFTACNARCDRTIQCNIERDATCFDDCLAQEFNADPLRALRNQQQNQCINFAGMECARVAECTAPPDQEPAVVVNLMNFCRLWNECDIEDFFGLPCEEAWRLFEEDRGAAACVVVMLRNGCPRDPESLFNCFEGGGGGPRGPGCLELCEALDVCGDLEGDRPQCIQQCGQEIQMGGDAAARQALRFPCGVAESCEALDLCLGGSDIEQSCAVYCGQFEACGIDSEDCAADCDARYFRARHTAARECVAATNDCAEILDCVPGNPPPCEAYCAGLQRCNANRQNCEETCDDAWFEDSDRMEAAFSCVLTTPECGGVGQCTRDPYSGGQTCLYFCQAESPHCDGDIEITDCIVECANGFMGDDAIRLAAAEPCLGQLRQGANCAQIDACIPDEANPDCPAWCAPLQGCGEIGVDCPELCAEDPLTGVRALRQTECLADAGDACEAVSECVIQYTEEPPGPNEADFCRRYNECGLDQEFRCEDFLQFFVEEGGPGFLRCADAHLQMRCPEDLFIFFDICQRGGEQILPESESCRRLCEAQGLCGQLDNSLAVCQLDCQSIFGPRGDQDQQAQMRERLPCGDALSCPALLACENASTPEGRCAAHCEQLDACGVADPQCNMDCQARFGWDRDNAWQACVTEANADCDAVRACPSPPAIPCEAYCEERAQCLNEDPIMCLQQCDDQHFADPQAASLEIACVLTANGCRQPREGHGVNQCFQGNIAEFDGITCYGYCRAVGVCDPDNERSLTDCLAACVGGFDDAEELRYAGAEGCIVDAGVGAICPVLRACIPDNIPIDCDEHCERLGACEVEPNNCVATCTAMPNQDQIGCVMGVGRGEGQCAAIAACVEAQVEPASPVCADYCNTLIDCDPARDRFLCERGCTPEPAGLMAQLGCAEVTTCQQINQCEEIEVEANEACDDLCEPLVACGAFADAETCGSWCAGASESPHSTPAILADLPMCVAELPAMCTRDDAVGCFSNPERQCRDLCDLLIICNPGGAAMECQGECLQTYQLDPGFTEGVFECGPLLVDCDSDQFEQCVQALGQPGR